MVTAFMREQRSEVLKECLSHLKDRLLHWEGIASSDSFNAKYAAEHGWQDQVDLFGSCAKSSARVVDELKLKINIVKEMIAELEGE